MTLKIKTDKQYARAMFTPESFSNDDNSVEVTFATAAPVLRYDWGAGRYFYEVLDMKGMRTERAAGTLPVLNNHKTWEGVTGVIGRASNIKLEKGVWKATVKFSNREDVKPIVQDVRDGILQDTSVGYKVFEYEKQSAPEGEIPTYIARDWESNEISFVTIPADAGAKARAEGPEGSPAETYEIKVRENTTDTMTPEQLKALKDAERQRAADITKAANDAGIKDSAFVTRIIAEDVTLAEAKIKIDAEKVRQDAAAATPATTSTVTTTDEERGNITKGERQRISTIQTEGRAAGLEEADIQRMVEDGTTVDKARAEIVKKFVEADPHKGTRNSTTHVGRDREGDMRMEATTAALVLRSMPQLARGENPVFSAEVIAEANRYRGFTLLDLAKASLSRAGVNVEGLSKMEIVGRAFTTSTSDFPVLLEGTNRRVLLAAYQAVEDTWRKFCTIGSVSDFRENKRLRMGTLSDLEVVNELGEFRNKRITDADYEKASIGTKGNIINVSRQMIINDDLSGFTRLTEMLGRAAARSIENSVYALLAENNGRGPLMVDGKALFHADHGNIAVAGAPSVAVLDAMRVQMARQKDKDGNDFLGIRPSIALVPDSLAGVFRILNGSQYDPDAANKLQRPNIVNGLFGNIIDTPRLNAPDYYAFANPNEEPVIEVNFLDGQQSPYMESENGFEVDGVKWKIRLDYGVDAIGYRGALLNEGA